MGHAMNEPSCRQFRGLVPIGSSSMQVIKMNRSTYIHFTYPRRVRLTLNDPQNTHFLPRNKLAAHQNARLYPVTIRPPAYLMVTKRHDYRVF